MNLTQNQGAAWTKARALSRRHEDFKEYTETKHSILYSLSLMPPIMVIKCYDQKWCCLSLPILQRAYATDGNYNVCQSKRKLWLTLSLYGFVISVHLPKWVVEAASEEIISLMLFVSGQKATMPIISKTHALYYYVSHVVIREAFQIKWITFKFGSEQRDRRCIYFLNFFWPAGLR